MKPIIDFCKKHSSYIIVGTIVLIAVVMILLVVIAKNKDNNDNTVGNSIINNTGTADNSQTSETTTEVQPESDEIGAELPEDETTGESETTAEPAEPIDYKYSIRVNTYTNCVTIYTKDENGNFTVPYKAMACSAGLGSNATPTGTYNILKYYKWCRMVDWTYSQYSYRIHGSIMFHSTPCALNLTLNGTTPSPYYSKGRVEVVEFNKLGSNASLGCIRLTVADAKWICDNCPTGTTTVIVSEPTDPLPKPEVIKIPENIPAECGGYVETLMPENHRVSPINWVYKKIYVAWDPTDPDPANPWHKYSATITSASTITVEEGSTLNDVKKYITAKDTCGNVINDKLVIGGTYDLNKTGKYTLNLSVTDALGRSASKTIALTVTKKTQPTTEATTEVTTELTTEADTTTDSTTDVTIDTTTEAEDTSEDTSENTTTEETTTVSDNNDNTEENSSEPTASDS